MAPTGMREAFQQRIRREAEHARRSEPARIVAKMNSLVDRTLIEELYAASQAGVRIDLIVRGICCLPPGIPGLSDPIRGISIVDRYPHPAPAYHFQHRAPSEHSPASAAHVP